MNEVADLPARSFASRDAMRLRGLLPGCALTPIVRPTGGARVMAALEAGKTFTIDVRLATTPSLRTTSTNVRVAGIAAHQDAGSPLDRFVPRVVIGNGSQVAEGAWFSPHERGKQ